MTAAGCERVARYLDTFLDRESRRAFDIERVSDHVSECATCYERFRSFFRTIELPESEYLRETLDELAGALYNLAKAIIRDRPPVNADDVTENVVITDEGGGSFQENREAGEEMIEDAEDFTGTSRVEGTDLEELRGLLENAESSRLMRLDLAIQIFGRVAELPSRLESETWNWLGVLHLQKEEFQEARRCLERALVAQGGAREARANIHCNLGYVHKHQGDLDAALRSARRAIVLAEEDGRDTYFGRFAALYFHVLRAGETDLDAARGLLTSLLGDQRKRFLGNLALESNRPVREALLASVLADLLPAGDS